MMTGHRVRIMELVYIGLINDVRRLIAAGCDVDEKDYCGDCAATLCVENNDAEILKILIEEANANVDVKDPLGRSALSRAKQLKHTEIAKMIEDALKLKNTKISKPTSLTLSFAVSDNSANTLQEPALRPRM